MTWGTPVQSFVFLGLLVFELEPMYATSDRQTDGQTDDGRRSPLNAPAPPLRGGGIIIDTVLQRIASTQQIGLLNAIIKRAVYINTHL